MYSLEVAQSANFLASSEDFEDFGIANAQDHSQWEPFGVFSIGALAKATLSETCDSLGSNSGPAPEVASIHIAAFPVAKIVRFSLNPLDVAPGGP